MRFVSWNVNGIRAGIKKGTFFEYLNKENPDIIGLQEVKAKFNQLESENIEEIKKLGYEIYWNEAQRPGYSGTAVLTKINPLNVFNGIDVEKLDLNHLKIDEVIENNHEGRVLTLEFEKYFFITVYTPNSKPDLSRQSYRVVWDEVFLKYLKYLEEKKGVIVCGDLNVAHKEIDLANPKANMTTLKKPGNAGFTDSERSSMNDYLNAGFIDTFRYFYPDKENIYSWWSNFGGARSRNVGWRIDYFLISEILKNDLKDAFIQDKVLGSDHSPVGIEIF
ncbi:exodeoxyribonuclease III [Candidatus Gracilibacteria bacterium]|nr:exodeoxyribonuclease III [Candidatus Gracilibacteria bacterium]